MDTVSPIDENSFKFLDLNFSTSLDNHCKNNAEVEYKNEHKRSVKNPNNYSNDPITEILEAYKLRFLDKGKLLVCTECEIILVSGSFDYHFRTFHGVNLNSNERSTFLLALNQNYKSKSLYVEPFAYTELQEHLTTNLHLLDYIPGLALIQGYKCTKCNLGESTVGLLHQSHRYFNILDCSDYKNFIKSKIQLICSDFKKFGYGVNSEKRAQLIDRSETKNSKLDDDIVVSCFQSKIHSDCLLGRKLSCLKSFSKEFTNGEVFNPMGKVVNTLTAEEIFSDLTNEFNLMNPQNKFDFEYNMVDPIQKLCSTPFSTRFNEIKSDSIDQIDTSASAASSNRKKVEDIVLKYINNKKQCKKIVDKLESFPISDTITLNDIVRITAPHHRPTLEKRIEMLNELEASKLFKITLLKKRIIKIAKVECNYKESYR